MKLPKILGIMICYNEEEFIYYALKSAMMFCEEIIVVDGAVSWIKELTGEPYSTDYTLREIKKVKKEFDYNGKIKLYRYSPENKIKMKNFALKKRTIEPKYLISVDADEIYKIKDIEKIVSFLEKNKRYKMVLYPFYHFYGDFWHIAIKDEPRGLVFSKFFRFKNGYYFIKDHLELCDEKGVELKRNAYLYPKNENSPHCYHYGHIYINEKRLMKYIYYYKRGHPNSKKSDKEIIEYVKNYREDYIWLKNPKTIVRGMKLVPFKGNHPKIMKSHPKYNFRLKEFEVIK